MDLIYLAGIVLFFGLDGRTRLRLRQAGRCQMSWLLIVSAVVAVALLIYLIVALLNPEALFMTNHAWLILGLYLLVLLLAAKPLGSYIANVMEGRPLLSLGVRGGLESALYRLCGVRQDEEMGWLHYALAILLFNLLGALVVYALQRLQVWLPLNPQGLANVSPDSSFNTAISFATNTNWQGYAGESTMGYLTQMLGLTVQNFLSAATGIVVVIALIRGFARHTADTIGNAWVDLTRVTLYVLLPIALVFAAGPGQPGRDPEPRRLPGRHDAGGHALRQAQARRRRSAAHRCPGCRDH